MWTRKKLIKEYIEFYKSRGCREIANAPLRPENDPTVLFTTAGMHPLVPYLLGQPHPMGKKLVNVQRCIRTVDIEGVGDDTHNTFFEMLGSWSLGEYWKEEAINYSYELYIKKLGLNKEKFHVTVFAGDEGLKIPRDEESAQAWKSLGIPKERIHYLGMEDNFWGPAGKTGPCGPDTEMFVDTDKEECSKNCKPGCGCGKYIEIGNNVFMQYNKTAEGKYEELKQKNVDTGMGVERDVAMLNGQKTIWENSDLKEIIKEIGTLTKTPYEENKKAYRVVDDHTRASVFILLEKIIPANTEQGYVLRRLIRRAVRYGKDIGIGENFLATIAAKVIELYMEDYPEMKIQKDFILREIDKEETKFRQGLEKGMNLYRKIVEKLKGEVKKKISGADAFLLYQSYGFPIEITEELARQDGIEVDMEDYETELAKHRELSQTSTAGRFAGGLADHSEETTKLHTATHLLLAAMNKVLGKRIEQRGSHITAERARFDFTYERKLTEGEVKKIEDLVNEWIKTGKEVVRKEMTLAQAKERGAYGAFEHKYGDRVSVYMIEGISMELCGGPHVVSLKQLGGQGIKISEQKSVGAGARRVKIVLAKG